MGGSSSVVDKWETRLSKPEESLYHSSRGVISRKSVGLGFEKSVKSEVLETMRDKTEALEL